jgi:hypothetical protein
MAIDHRDQVGKTALHYTVDSGNTTAARLLVGQAELSLIDASGRNALTYAEDLYVHFASAKMRRRRATIAGLIREQL